MIENTTELTSWTELINSRNYPIPDGLNDFDFGLQTEQNEIKNKQYFKDNKNKTFLNKRSTALCLTIHKPWQYYKTPNDLIEIFKQLDDVTDYYCFSLEIGSGNTFHIQGYIRFQYAKRLRYKALLKLLKTTDINLEDAKGSATENLTYISKAEDEKINKWIVTYGDYQHDTANRKNFNCSEFVDYVIKNNIRINDVTLDLYCADYRRSPDSAKNTVTSLYNARISRFKDDGQILQHLTFCGNTGSGKSLITEYLLRRINAKLNLDVVKMEANKGRERLWFNKDASLKSICWISEMTWYFPNKTHLLSLLDRQSNLDVKGKDAVPNMFDVLLLNSTAITPYTIYNVSQNADVSYREIARRLFDYGKTYFVFPNEEWQQKDFLERQQLLKDNWTATVEKYAPRIYENVTPTYPNRLTFNLSLPYRHQSELITNLELTTSNTVTETIAVDDVTYKGNIKHLKLFNDMPYTHDYDDYSESATVTYTVRRVTLDDVYNHFIAVLKTVNSNILNAIF